MNVRTPSSPPARLALIADHEAAKQLTAAILQGQEALPPAALDDASTPLGDEPRWDADPIRDLVDEAMDRFADRPTQADAWLAPRLHATLRLTRREAAESSLFNFLAMRLAPDWVFWRHPPKASKKHPIPRVNAGRFNGAYHLQTFSRLWWAAELFRNGGDYQPVEVACGNQDVLHTALRLEIIYHRGTAQAIIRLLQQGDVRTGRDINALAQAVNAAGSTLVFETLAPDLPSDVDAYREWLEALGSAYVPYDSLPNGPDDGAADEVTLAALIPLFKRLFVEAPVRGKEHRSYRADA